MEILTIHSADFEKYGNALVHLYLTAFSTGENFQYHDKEDTKIYLQSILKVGYGIIAFENSCLLGAILLTPLTFDDLVPDSISQNYTLAQSIYVSEMMIDKPSQGRGIGKKLLLYFMETVDRETYHDAFIRVWVENAVAVGLYEKIGFTKCASIEQTKLLADKSDTFIFKKNYLHHTLSNR